MKRIFPFLGLLRSMSRPQIEAVLGHEISHVANGDMVTLALLQGVLNTFVIFLARIIGSIVDRALFKNDRQQSGIGFFSPRWWRRSEPPAARRAYCGNKHRN
jgi:Zn-dependent protease with chaperone function